MKEIAGARRPLKSRSAGWAKYLAKELADAGVTPTKISIIGLIMAGCAGFGFYLSKDLGAITLPIAALCIHSKLKKITQPLGIYGNFPQFNR